MVGIDHCYTDFLKLTTITVSKVIVSQFTLSLTTFLPVRTMHVKTSNLLISGEFHKFFIITNWTDVVFAFANIPTKLIEQIDKAHTQVRISTGKETY